MWKSDDQVIAHGRYAALHPHGYDDAWEERAAAIRELQHRGYTETQAITLIDSDEN